MLQPVYAPLHAANKIEGLQAHLAAAVAPAPILTTLAVRRFGQVDALVIVHTDDGAREPLTSHEARGVARTLRAQWSGLDRRMIELAASLDDAAEAADRQASVILLSQGSDAGVRSSRIFGGR